MTYAPYIQTHSGQHIELENPDPEKIVLGDIAHALSHLCRFTGHTDRFYCVAQHSVRCSTQAQHRSYSESVQREALLHDAAEAYLGDVSSPLKSLLPNYKNLERVWQAAIAKRFALPREHSKYVKILDVAALHSEARELLPGGPSGPGWPPGEPFEGVQAIAWGPELAREIFMSEADRLGVR